MPPYQFVFSIRACIVYPPCRDRLIFVLPMSIRAAGRDEVAPKGLGSGTRKRQELAHECPPRSASHKDRTQKAFLHGGGVPCGESDSPRRGVVVPSDGNRGEDNKKNGKGGPCGLSPVR